MTKTREWISVEERLPRPKKDLWVHVKYDTVTQNLKRRLPTVRRGWLKYAAGDKNCPQFIIPQRRPYLPCTVLYWQYSHRPDPPEVTP